jgi:hypothetical protein
MNTRVHLHLFGEWLPTLYLSSHCLHCESEVGLDRSHYPLARTNNLYGLEDRASTFDDHVQTRKPHH